ncbi:AzlC family ABC transporter permease [Desulfurispora thermophila]|uniref:AzlC family ABC transporter permease n=1 Tax=Desulfurispora thermophila TaxID=265470 RepID=UPI0003A8BB41|nr:AzlC family ABC transporter permease [Desulfurispora thermophila]
MSTEMIVERQFRPGGRQEFLSGVGESLPVLLGVLPFGLACGVMGRTVGLTAMETVAMSVFVFAGSAQFVSLTMLGAGITAPGIIILTTLLINLRHILMGASLAPYLLRLPLWWQALLAFGMADETYALTIGRIQRSGYHHLYQLGCNLAFYCTWVTSTAAGVYLGGYIPDPMALGLDFAMPAMFLALLVPRLQDRVGVVVCIVAAVTALLGALYLPGKWYILLAGVVASGVGGLLEGRRKAGAC